MHEITIQIAGATNFRSLGGLPAADGRRLRSHALMRADRLVGLDEHDWQALARTGLATICDLRSDAERAEHPNAVPSALRVHELNCRVNNDLRADPSLARLMAEDPSARGAERVMIEIYRALPELHGHDARPRSSSGCSRAARRCSCTAQPARTEPAS